MLHTYLRLYFLVLLVYADPMLNIIYILHVLVCDFDIYFEVNSILLALSQNQVCDFDNVLANTQNCIK